MWPYLFGPGWIWGVLVSAGLLAVTVAAAAAGAAGGRRAALEPDPIQRIWHQYEQGDLTLWEFVRDTNRIDSLLRSP